MLILIISMLVIFCWWVDRNEKKSALAAFDKSNFIHEIKRFNPKEGDTIIVRTLYEINSEELRQKLKDSHRKFLELDPKFKVVLLQGGDDIEISRTAKTQGL